tara:strand:- start:5780 stop:6088 length:309 start_codon:yes stop_codon:yes gene_type:complete
VTTTEPHIILTFLLMGAIIYLNRILGYFIVSRVKINAKLETWLNYLPGCILTAIVAPFVLTADTAEFIAAIVIVMIMWFSDRILLSMVSGIAIVAVFRYLFG